MTVTLRTGRLILDTPDRLDIDTILELCQDPEIHRWVPLPWPYERSNAEFFVENYVQHGLVSGTYETWAMRTSVDRAMIGAIELRRDEAERSASLGCWLGKPSRGRSYVKEAAQAVIEYGMGPDGPAYTRLCWEGLVGNEASRSIATSLGFVIEPDSGRTFDFRGERRPSWLGVLVAPGRGRQT